MLDPVRKSIFDDYFTSVVVIEDDPGDKYEGIKEACKKEGILFQIYEYHSNLISNKSDLKKSIKTPAKLCSRSSVSIIDWELIRGDSSASLALLDSLASERRGLRFVVIYSHIDSQSIVDAIKDKYRGKFKSLEKTAQEISTTTNKAEIEFEKANDDSGVFTDSNEYCLNNSLYILVRKKNALQEVESLMNELEALFNKQFSDMIHWAGFEFGNRIRNVIPELLSSLPKGIDGPLLHQSFFQADPEDVSFQIAEIFAREINGYFQSHPLDAVSDNIRLGRIKKIIGIKPKISFANYPWYNELQELDSPNEKKTAFPKDKKKELEKKRSLLNDLESMCNKETLFFEELPKTVNLLTNKKESDPMNTFLSTCKKELFEEKFHDAWAALNESSLFPPADTKKIMLGSILCFREGKKDNIYLCITPACDCARPEKIKFTYLLVEGCEFNSNDLKGKLCTTANVYFDGKLEIKNYLWQRSKIQSIQFKDDDKWAIIGRLRPDVVASVIQTLWTQQARIGLNTAEHVRLRRNGSE